VLIKSDFGKRELESSQFETGVPIENPTFSIVARNLDFLTEIVALGGQVSKTVKNVGKNEKRRTTISRASGVNSSVTCSVEKIKAPRSKPSSGTSQLGDHATVAVMAWLSRDSFVPMTFSRSKQSTEKSLDQWIS
jgi:hypothetical protein